MALREDYEVRSIGKNRGKPRIYLDTHQIVRAGFSPGTRYDVIIDGDRVELRANKDGSAALRAVKTLTVSSKKKREKEVPVIDINSAELLKVFDGMDAVRMIVRQGVIYFLPLASEQHMRDRLQRLRGRAERAEKFVVASIAHGGGILSRAIHEGLERAGVESSLVFANEIRADLIEQAAEKNDVWNEDTRSVIGPMQEIVQDEWLMERLPKVDVLELGLPCSGATRAGIAKRSLKKMEDHEEVGHLVFAALVMLNRMQPALVVFENVPLYSDTSSASILRKQLRDMGYSTHEAILSGKDFGSLENRVRWCMVATTRGLSFSFDQLAPTLTVVRTLGEVLDDIPDDDPRWSNMEGLKAKQVRDREKGSNFKMQVFNKDSTFIGTLTKGLSKNRSTDPKIANEKDPSLLRVLTANEHARIKGVPESLIEGLSHTIAHEMLGQSIVYEPFAAVEKRMEECILRYLDEVRANQVVGEKKPKTSQATARRRAVVG